MTKDWKKIAKASGLSMADADAGRIAPALDELEAAFRPLVKTIGLETDLAVIFQADGEERQ